jgi:hypothetical protein
MAIRKSLLLFTVLGILLFLSACKEPAEQDLPVQPIGNIVPYGVPTQHAYVRASDGDFSFEFPKWKNSSNEDPKLFINVVDDGCAVFMEVSNASFSDAFDSSLKFLKSGEGKSVVSSNATRGIIEHKRWDKDRTHTLYSATKFVACNDYVYVVTITCDTTKIDTNMKSVYERVINSAHCAGTDAVETGSAVVTQSEKEVVEEVASASAK